MPEIQHGTYQHFKGGIYQVTGIVRHSETEEWLVLYKDSRENFWVRPYDMFFETVVHEGQLVNRFTYIGDAVNC